MSDSAQPDSFHADNFSDENPKVSSESNVHPTSQDLPEAPPNEEVQGNELQNEVEQVTTSETLITNVNLEGVTLDQTSRIHSC
jgi:hypothetical protein